MAIEGSDKKAGHGSSARLDGFARMAGLAAGKLFALGSGAMAQLRQERDAWRAGRCLRFLDTDGACDAWLANRFDPDRLVPTSFKLDAKGALVLPGVDMGDDPAPVRGELPFRVAMRATLEAREPYLEEESIAKMRHTIQALDSWGERLAISRGLAPKVDKPEGDGRPARRSRL